MCWTFEGPKGVGWCLPKLRRSVGRLLFVCTSIFSNSRMVTSGFGWRATLCWSLEGPKGVGWCLPKLRRSVGRVLSVWYVYFLQLKNGDIYVGSTNDLRRRIGAHREGRVPSTRIHNPVVLRAYVAVDSALRARRRERYFKSGSGKAVAVKRFIQNPAA